MSAERARFREHPVEYLLGLFAEVRAGEAATALLLTANVFVLLTAYYFLKVAREPLILTGGGAEVKSYAAAGQSVLLIFVAWGYGWLARHVDRLRLITIVTLFFVANLAIFWLLGVRGVPLGVPFYLWVGIFSLTVIAQFWAFAADIYTQEQGKRLFPVIGIGSSLGSVAGAAIAREAARFGPFVLMLAAAALLLVCLGFTAVVHRREAHRTKPGETKQEEPMGTESGFTLLLRDRYLLLIGALVFVLNWVNTNGEYVLDKTLLASAAESAAREGLTVPQFVGRFKAEYFAWVNVIGVVLQLFVVSRVLRYVGVRRALFLMPLVSLGGYSVMAFAPLLSLVFVAKVAENSLDYSLQNTARQALWLLTSRDDKYKAKQVIDTFLQRAGDVMSAGLVWLGGVLAFRTLHFVVCNVVLIGVWIVVLRLLANEHARRDPPAPEVRP